LTPITIYFVPPNDPRIHCDLFWERLIADLAFECSKGNYPSHMILWDLFWERLIADLAFECSKGNYPSHMIQVLKTGSSMQRINFRPKAGRFHSKKIFYQKSLMI
jgi:hypothetical protein